MDTANSMDSVWQKAAIIGGLWASVEIIVGSFLHNVRIPFSGSILAFFGIILLVAFSKLWPGRGMIWRAGLICALMKSVSPSAVILGPMTGILAEALLLQLFVNLFGRNLVGYISGGIFSLMSALFHKVISLFILYGLDLFKIYLNLYYFAAKQVRIQQADPWVLILIVVGIYVLFGTLAAILGYYVGKQSSLLSSSESQPDENMKAQVADPVTSFISKYSLFYHFLHLLLLPICLYFINKADAHYMWIIPGSYCILILLRYSKHLNRLKKPFFWMQIVIVALLAALFWSNSADMSPESQWQGLWVGLQLNFRAILVIFSFTAISAELKNPRIQQYLVTHGFRNVYWSLNLAFSVLPFMMKNMGKGRSFFTHPLSSLSLALSKSNHWLEYIQSKSVD